MHYHNLIVSIKPNLDLFSGRILHILHWNHYQRSKDNMSQFGIPLAGPALFKTHLPKIMARVCRI